MPPTPLHSTVGIISFIIVFIADPLRHLAEVFGYKLIIPRWLCQCVKFMIAVHETEITLRAPAVPQQKNVVWRYCIYIFISGFYRETCKHYSVPGMQRNAFWTGPTCTLPSKYVASAALFITHWLITLAGKSNKTNQQETEILRRIFALLLEPWINQYRADTYWMWDSAEVLLKSEKSANYCRNTMVPASCRKGQSHDSNQQKCFLSEPPLQVRPELTAYCCSLTSTLHQ